MTNLQQVLEKHNLQDKEIEAYQDLQRSLENLHSIQADLNQVIYGQSEKIDSIRDHIETSNIKIESGLDELREAQRLSVKYTPILIGSVIGILIGGPFGLIPGFKAGGAIAVSSGGLLGGFLGYKIQK